MSILNFHTTVCILLVPVVSLRARPRAKPRERNLNPKDIVYKWLVLGRRPTIYTRSLWVHVLVGVLSLGILSRARDTKKKNLQNEHVFVSMIKR